MSQLAACVTNLAPELDFLYAVQSKGETSATAVTARENAELPRKIRRVAREDVSAEKVTCKGDSATRELEKL